MHHVQGKTAVLEVLEAATLDSHAVSRVTAVALGSNLGDRHAHLSFAVAALDRLLGNMRVSPLIETAPVGVSPQPCYLNGVAVGNCACPPEALLAALMRIEKERGRERPHPGAARTLDLDLVLMGDLIVRGPHLDLPHPRFRERRFVLAPLAAMTPDLADPVTGRTMRELLAALPPASPDADQFLPSRASRLQAPGPADAR